MKGRKFGLCRLSFELGFLVALSCATGSVTAMAQVETTSRVSGIVSDPTGAVIPGASVTVRNEATGALREATTDQGGYYSVVSLQPGTYTVTVSKAGFRKAEVTGQVLQVASPARLDFALQLGAENQVVTVTAAGAELITTTTSEISGTLNETLVTEIPLKRQNFFDLLILTPGAVPQNLHNQLSFGSRSLNRVSTGGGGDTGEITQSGVFVAGNRDSGANVSVDGSNVQSSVYQQATQLQTPASIQEVKVEAGNMNAEFGGGVSAVNVITKSGTNVFHGEAYEFLRNNHLDAAPFFTNLLGRKLPNYQQNVFGGAFAGPIRNDKLLFFASYEGMRARESSVGFEQVPPAGVFTGDFSGMPTIYNPFKFDPVTGLRQPFPGNQIPLGPTNLCAPRRQCADPTTLAFLQKWVKPPNTTVNDIPHFMGTSKTTLDSDQFSVRVDFLQSIRSTIYGRFTHLNAPQTSKGVQPLEGTNNPYSSNNGVVHWSEVITAALVNDLMVSYTRPGWGLTRITEYGNVGQQIGLKNIGGDPGAPYFEGVDYTLDTPAEYILNALENNYQFKDDVNFLRGRHSMKFGMEARQRRFYFNSVQQDQSEINFENIFSQACPAGNAACRAALAASGRDSGGSILADFLLGTPSEALLVLTPKYYAYQTYYGLYAQDSWRATPRLTLNFGLRYELWRPWLVPHNTTAQWDGVNGRILYALQNPLDYLDNSKCLGGCAPLNSNVPRQGYRTGKRNFAPRLGFAFELTPKTVLRAAGGIFYDGNQNGVFMQNIQSTAPPFGQRVDLIATPNEQIPTYFVSELFPAPATGGIPQPNTGASFRALQPYLPTAAVYQWSSSLQRAISSYWSVEMDYLGSHTIHEPMFMDLNSARLPVGQYAGLSLQQRRIFPQWGRIGSWIPIGWAKYHAMVVSMRNREWHGLTLVSNFTWAKGLATSDLNQSDIGISNIFAPYILAGEAQWVPRRSLVTGYNYALPFGHGKALGNSRNPVLNKLSSGWSFSGITTFSTGSPQPVYAEDDFTGVGLSRAYPNRICDPTNAPRDRLQWFNTSCFVDAPFGTWPNTPLGAIVFPGINNWDLSITKDTVSEFPTKSARLQFRADLFNAFNHTQWANPNVNYYSGSKGFGRITSTRPARKIQFALRYYF